MNRFTTMFTLTVGAALSFAQFAVAHDELAQPAQPAQPAQAISASAHGGYFATYGRNQATRRIEFTANRDSLNNQKGQGSFFNTTSGLKIHFTIDCLRVEGNVATMSGIWGDGQGNFPFLWLQVIDNGEGNNAHDKVSPMFASDVPVSCSDEYFSGAMYDIDASGGNIQVR